MRVRQKQPRLKLSPEEYTVIRNRVLKRDSWRCQDCGAVKGLQGGLAGRGHVICAAGRGNSKRRLIAGNHSGQTSCYPLGQIKSTSRSARLICDDLQFLSFGGETQYCQQEISSVRGVDPGCGKYQVRGARIANRLFAREFRSAVRVEWIWFGGSVST
jgi:hypothetical protein